MPPAELKDMTSTQPPSHASGLDARDYLEQRLTPRPGDPHYLHLKDLVGALRLLIPGNPGRVLDFGCGGAPYRSLFNTQDYVRADLRGTPGAEVEFSEDSRLPISAGTFDLVFSSQVLEHVSSPAAYLAECNRVLRPGGRLLISTHGTFNDHGCPHDFRRWTLDGLKLELKLEGFHVLEGWKLTNGPRALLYLLRAHERRLLPGSHSPSGLALRLLRLPFRCFPSLVDRACDRHFSTHSVQRLAFGNGEIYIGIILLAEKTTS